MTRKIDILLENKRQKFAKTKQPLSENVTIRKTKTFPSGYYLLITSDLPGSQGSSEAARMSKILKIGMKDTFPYNFEKPKHFKDNSTGIFGWGYFVSASASEERKEKIMNDLKFLVGEYNKLSNIEADAKVEGMTPSQVEELTNVVQAVEKSADSPKTNQDAKRNLNKFLDDLAEAVENEEVFEFLIQNFEKAKTFQKRNTAWKYSILNSLTITSADPSAKFSGPAEYWNSIGYKIKDINKDAGITIIKPKSMFGGGKSQDLQMKADYFKKHPEALVDFKKEMGISTTEPFDINNKDNRYRLAKFATEKNYLGYERTKSWGGFEEAQTYTDNMIEPVAGKNPVDLEYNELSGFSEKPYEENLAPLFDAAMSIVKNDGISIPSALSVDKTSTTNFSRILNAIAMTKVLERFAKGKRENEVQNMELLKIHAESVTNIIKRYFKIPAESSKYSVASWGGDKENIKKHADVIINIANSIIDKMEQYMDAHKEGLYEIRKLVKKLIEESFK